MGDTDELGGEPTSAGGELAGKMASAIPTLDGLERRQTKEALRDKLFGRKKETVRIGRFVVIKRLGAGGMGVVFAAYDSELDRKVAIKLIRPETIQAKEAEQRLVREARALAKLSHPNVVQIYDVGTHEEQVYVAMEYIDGETLSEWLAHEPARSLDEIKAMFLAAGRGLAAAHEAGLVHRDFKPANVLVAKDGQVRVLDFGLARQLDRPEPEAPDDATGEAPTERAELVSRAGAVMGTPAYMSPEQHLGAPIDARTDQFSFCIALYEAVYGERPFGGESLMQLSLAVTTGEMRAPPRGRTVPEYLRQLLVRGLATDPEQRYPSMEALLADLARDPGARRRRILLAGGMAAAIVGSVAGTYYLRESQLEMCAGAEERLIGIWDDARKTEVNEALLATGLPLATDTWSRVEVLLDEYSAGWAEQHAEACRATLLGEQSEEMLDLRMRCLDRRRRELAAFIDVLATAEAGAVEGATEAASHLPRLEMCADLEALAAEVKPPDDPQTAAAVEELRAQLAQTVALETGASYDEALSIAEEATKTASGLDYPPVLAEAQLRRGLLLYELQRYEEAEGSISDAYYTALEADHNRVAANAASSLVRLLAKQSRFDDATVWVRHATSTIKKIGSGGAEEARALESEGELLESQDRFDDAQAKFEQALAIHNETLGENHPVAASVVYRLGQLAYRAGEYDRARGFFERALNMQEQAFGPNHPAVAKASTGLGITLKELEEYEAARGAHERALEIQQSAFGDDHPNVARPLTNLGAVLREMGRYDEALRAQTRALSIRRKAFGDDHRLVAQSLANVGVVEEFLGNYADARAHQEQALAIRERLFGKEHRSVANSLTNLGDVAFREGNHEQAIELHERALAIIEKNYGSMHPDVAHELTHIADPQIALGRHEQARDNASRALSILDAREGDEFERATARFALARALWPTQAERTRSITLARRALDGFQSSGKRAEDRVREAENWLRERE